LEVFQSGNTAIIVHNLNTCLSIHTTFNGKLGKSGAGSQWHCSAVCRMGLDFAVQTVRR
jgi:hypothetical protein